MRWLPKDWSDRVIAWLPQQTLVRDIQFHPYDGITGYTQGNGIKTSKRFDIAGRMTALQVKGQTDISVQTLRYGIGLRIKGIEEAQVKRAFDYDGFGRLKPEAQAVKTALNAQAEPQPAQHDAQGRTTQDERYRYTYTADGQIETVSNLQGQPVARYRYNANKQRVSKTVYQGSGSHTTYYLWQQGKLVAEIEGSGEHQGEVTAQYLYLGDQGQTAPGAKLESERAEGNRTGKPRTLYVHVDHRGQPVAMTDQVQHIVWRASPDTWGYVQTVSAQEAVLNIRLPGQYHDEETSLHDNWHRSYDPRPESADHGRYLSPDPLGYPDGPDPYSYVNGDPVNRVDPTGLYEEDVHYYVTYFLAVMAGLAEEDALVIASADRYR